MKKIVLTLLTLTGIITLAGCSKTQTNKLSFKQMAENSALSSISMLSTPTTKAMHRALSEDDKSQVLKYLDLVDEMLKGEPIRSEEKALEANSEYANLYDKYYTLTVNGLDNKKDEYTFYYKETLVDQEDDDKPNDKKEEEEVSSDLSGIVIIGDKKYIMDGHKEVSKEGKEVEVEYEFKIVDEADKSRFVMVSQEVETEGNETENEYVYAKYENGKKIEEVNIEYEQEDGETLYVVSNKSKGNNETYKFSFEKDVVKVHIHTKGKNINAKLYLENGKYVFKE